MAQRAQELRVIAPDQYEPPPYMVTRDTTVAVVRYIIACLRNFPEAEMRATLVIGRDFIPVPDYLNLWAPATHQFTLVFHRPGHIPRFVENGDDAGGDQKRAKVVIVPAIDGGIQAHQMAQPARELRVVTLRVVTPDQYEPPPYMVTYDTTVAIVRSGVAQLRNFPEAAMGAMLGIGRDFIPVPDSLHLWEPAMHQFTLVFHFPGHIPRFVENGDDADGDQKRAKVVIVPATLSRC